MNQYQVCLYSVECISLGDSKYGHKIPQLWHFFTKCVQCMTCRLHSPAACTALKAAAVNWCDHKRCVILWYVSKKKAGFIKSQTLFSGSNHVWVSCLILAVCITIGTFELKCSLFNLCIFTRSFKVRFPLKGRPAKTSTSQHWALYGYWLNTYHAADMSKM